MSEYRREPLRNKNMGKKGFQVFDTWMPKGVGGMDIDQVVHSFGRDHALIIEAKPATQYPDVSFGQLATLKFLAGQPNVTVLLVWEHSEEFQVEVLSVDGSTTPLCRVRPTDFGLLLKAWKDGKWDFDRSTGNWRAA